MSAVEALPDAEQETIESIALEDGDAGIRRAAVGKLASIDTLVRIARDDQDDTVRQEARELLVGVAQDSTNPQESAAALRGLSDPRDLAAVARSAEIEQVALDALNRLDDAKLATTVARQAIHAAVRQAALARVTEAEDLLSVALKSEHRDVGLAALERLTSHDHVEQVASRARNKILARRARTMLREFEERERVAQAERAAAAQRVVVCERAEALVQSGDTAKAGDHLAALQAEWQLLGDGGDAATRERWELTISRVQDLLARSEAERAAAQQRASELAIDIAQAVEQRTALCEKVEALDGETAAAGLDEARTVWVALPPWPEGARQTAQPQQVEQRFARACDECERRIARHRELGAQRSALDALLAEAARALQLPDFAAARSAWRACRQQWFAQSGPQVADRALIEQWTALETRMAVREAEARESRAREAQGHMARMIALAEQVERLSQQPELPLKETERLVREARAALDRPGYFPTRHDQEQVVERLRAAYAAVQPRVQELKESEEWRRWANATVQEELCAKAEALAQVSDPAEVARQLRDLQHQWKKVGAAPRERGEDLWKRFKTACDAAWARCSEHLAQQRDQELANLQQKEALCAQAEALTDSTDWIRTSEELKRLQGEWQKIGPVPRDQAKVLWDRFHAACDRFFTRRKTDLAERKVLWAENQKKKEALCVRAEALAESTDWNAAAAELKQLQAEWRAVGPVRRQKAEALWKRFRAACDTFFERYKQRDRIDLAVQVSSREAICEELERLTPEQPADVETTIPDRAQYVDSILEIWRRWQDAPRLPRGASEQVEERFQAAIDRLFASNAELFRGTRLDVDSNRARMERLCVQVEGLVAGRITPQELAAAPAATIATMLKDALAANTIGGKVDDETRWRTASAAMRDAQSAWRRLGPVPGPVGRDLEQRFRRACRRFNELRPAQPSARATTV